MGPIHIETQRRRWRRLPPICDGRWIRIKSSEGVVIGIYDENRGRIRPCGNPLATEAAIVVVNGRPAYIGTLADDVVTLEPMEDHDE